MSGKIKQSLSEPKLPNAARAKRSRRSCPASRPRAPSRRVDPSMRRSGRLSRSIRECAPSPATPKQCRARPPKALHRPAHDTHRFVGVRRVPRDDGRQLRHREAHQLPTPRRGEQQHVAQTTEQRDRERHLRCRATSRPFIFIARMVVVEPHGDLGAMSPRHYVSVPDVFSNSPHACGPNRSRHFA